MNFSISEEKYIKAIWQLQVTSTLVTTTALADELKARPASITDMMKKLSAKKLLHYKPYYGFTLSSEGRKAAVEIIRRHRLWEFFLAEKLGFAREEIGSIAGELEHVRSKKLIDKLDGFLGFPRIDPHGDPIPDQKGRMKSAGQFPLSRLKENEKGEICRLAASPALMQVLSGKQLEVGSKVKVKKIFSFDDSLEIVTKSRSLSLSQEMAQSIYVKKL